MLPPNLPLTLFLIAITNMAVAQEWRGLAPDALFLVARDDMFAGNRAAGQEKLRYLLGRVPGYDDAGVLLARSFAWDGRYGEAREGLQRILRKDSLHRDAAHALADVEQWSGDFDAALAIARQAAMRYPDDADFIYQSARALASMGRGDEALRHLKELRDAGFGHEGAIKLYDSLRLAASRYVATVRSGVEFFDRIFDPSTYLTAQVGRADAWGSSSVRLNYSQRFSRSGVQAEVDLYPRIAKGVTGYLTYGYSESVLFPEHRAGGELFFSLPAALEASAGATYMDFRRGARIVMVTGSAGWYFRNYWFSARGFVAPRQEGKTSFSGTVMARRYFASADDFIELNGGGGFSADLTRMQNGAALREGAVDLLRSHRVGVACQRRFAVTWTISLSVDLTRQALLFDRDAYVVIMGSFVTLKRTF